MIAMVRDDRHRGRGQTQTAYTAAQAAEGLAAYQTNCASCHLPDLVGRNEAPQLAGGNFMNAWGSRTTAELIRYMQASMPPSNRGGLSDETYANIVAFILEANGALAGDRPLAASSPVRIDSVANGQMPAAVREVLARAAVADQAMAPRASGAERHHCLRPGEELRSGHGRDAAQSRIPPTG